MRVGMTELLVIFVVALIVIGPDKLPAYAKKLGEALAEFKKFSNEATKEIRESVVEPLEEAQQPLREAMAPVTELQKEVQGNVKDLKQAWNAVGKSASSDKEKKDLSENVISDKSEEETESIPEFEAGARKGTSVDLAASADSVDSADPAASATSV